MSANKPPFINPLSGVQSVNTPHYKWYICNSDSFPTKCVESADMSDQFMRENKDAAVPILSLIPKIFHRTILEVKLGKPTVIADSTN